MCNGNCANCPNNKAKVFTWYSIIEQYEDGSFIYIEDEDGNKEFSTLAEAQNVREYVLKEWGEVKDNDNPLNIVKETRQLVN